MAGNPRKSAGKEGTWFRRDFLSSVGWLGILGSLGGMSLMFVRFMYPRVNFDPPTVFGAGDPANYARGEVSEKYVPSQRTWIVHTEDAYIAVYAECTHLGCTPRWFKAEDKFKCPCHGTGFRGVGRGTDEVGVNFEGPAPRPLERCHIELSEGGELVIDFGRRFKRDSTVNEFDEPGSKIEG